MNITVNGIPREIGEGITLAALLEELELRPTHVAVEVNLELAPRTQHSERLLQENDRIEIVTLVGGG